MKELKFREKVHFEENGTLNNYTHNYKFVVTEKPDSNKRMVIYVRPDDFRSDPDVFLSIEE